MYNSYMRYFVNDLNKPFKLISCGNLISLDGFLHMRRCLDHYVLILVLEGTLHITQNGSEYDIEPQHYILLRTNEVHFGSRPSSGRLSYYWAHFDDNKELVEIEEQAARLKIVSPVTDNVSMSDKMIMTETGNVARSPRASLLFGQLLDLSRQRVQFPMQTDYALSLLLMEVSRAAIETYSDLQKQIPPTISRIIEWLRANCHETISVRDVAAEFGYNPDYLSALFHKTTGSTMTNYLNKLRIDISKTLLANYSVTVREAAYSCGFSDEKYYMRLFKKLEGMTPSQFRHAFSEKSINME